MFKDIITIFDKQTIGIYERFFTCVYSILFNYVKEKIELVLILL